MPVFQSLRAFLREFSAMMHHARTGRPPQQRNRRDPDASRHAEMVDGWRNERFHQAYSRRRP